MDTLRVLTDSNTKTLNKEDHTDVLDDIVVEDKDDWLDSDWTEITQADLNSSSANTVYKDKDITSQLTPLLESKLDKFLDEVEFTISHYFEANKRSEKSKLDTFIDICKDSIIIENKVKEEREDNQRLIKKLDDLDNELSTILVSQIGNTISLECDFVDAKVSNKASFNCRFLRHSTILILRIYVKYDNHELLC